MFRRKSNPAQQNQIIKNHEQEDENNHDLPLTQHEEKISELKAVIGPLSGRALQFCTNACLRRYLEARNWNVEKSKKMLEDTLKWRESYKPEEIRWGEVAIEGETGKVFRANFHDRYGRTVLIMRPAKQNTKCIDNNIKHLVYLLENAILNLAENQEQMVWLIDFTGWSMSNSVPIRSAHDTIHILQSHYPERLAVVILYSPPWIFETFWKVVKYFMDPKTFQKVKFVYPKNKEGVDLMKSYFDVDNLPKEFGGKTTLEYDYQEFSKRMVEDDVKADRVWGIKQKQQIKNGSSEVAPEPDEP